jgi:hypothetical protein
MGALSLLAVMPLILAGSAALAQNLLVNPDFSQGKPGDADFGWTVDLAQGQKSECTVVSVKQPAEIVPVVYRPAPAGRTPGPAAIRLYNDELGTSYISQEVTVQPGRWYVAEVWVNSEGMASLDFGFSISLGQDRDIYDSMINTMPERGWRALHLMAYSGTAERLTLKMGAGLKGITGQGGCGWSGELLLSSPVVREVGLVEAAWYRSGATGRPPPASGPAIAPEGDQQGYAFQTGEVCTVAPEFPNPLCIAGRMNAKAPEGRISLALPPGVRFKKHTDKSVTAKVSEMANGFQRVELPPGYQILLVSADLRPGEDAVGYVQFEWNGGHQVPTPVCFQGIALPRVAPPQRAMVSLGIYNGTYLDWDGDQAAMVRDIKRFGYSHLEVWGGDPRGFYANGIQGVTAFGGGFNVKDKYPEALAVTPDGKPCGEDLISPSYRGPALQEQIDRVKAYAKLSSALTLDDESYGMSAMSPAICFHPRTLERWKGWVAEHEPGLAGVEPAVFTKQPHKYRTHYDAWLRFRCDLFAELYGILRDEFHKGVAESGVKTTQRPLLGAYIGGGPVHSLHANESLARVLDYVANMVYEDADGVRKATARLAPLTGKKLVIAISPGYIASPPGDARSQTLEALMGGAQGVIAWGYGAGVGNGYTTGHLADMADAVAMFAPVEDIILDGTVQGGYTCDSPAVNLLARTLKDAAVLLVSDYSPSPGRVTVSVPGDAPVAVKDQYSGEVVAKLTAQQRQFTIELRRDFRAKLYLLQP